MKIVTGCALASAFALSAVAAQAAEIPLYPTGPAEDSAFVRFVNVGAEPMELQASGSKARLSLTPAAPVSDFLPVAAGKPVKGTLTRQGQRAAVDVTVKPGEFATVFGLPSAKGALASAVVKEAPDDFNALRASIAFYNVDPACAQAGLRTAGRNVEVFAGVPAGEARRRLINPVTLTVEITCAGKAQGKPVELGALAAGQRYSLFVVPDAKGSRAMFATDALAR